MRFSTPRCLACAEPLLLTSVGLTASLLYRSLQTIRPPQIVQPEVQITEPAHRSSTILREPSPREFTTELYLSAAWQTVRSAKFIERFEQFRGLDTRTLTRSHSRVQESSNNVANGFDS